MNSDDMIVSWCRGLRFLFYLLFNQHTYLTWDHSLCVREKQSGYNVIKDVFT